VRNCSWAQVNWLTEDPASRTTPYLPAHQFWLACKTYCCGSNKWVEYAAYTFPWRSARARTAPRRSAYSGDSSRRSRKSEKAVCPAAHPWRRDRGLASDDVRERTVFNGLSFENQRPLHGCFRLNLVPHVPHVTCGSPRHTCGHRASNEQHLPFSDLATMQSNGQSSSRSCRI
jgi:hypothetical protein